MDLVAVLDWFRRSIVRWERDQTLTQPFVRAAVERTLAQARPTMMNSDQCRHFTRSHDTRVLLGASVPVTTQTQPVQIVSFGSFRVFLNSRPLSLSNAGTEKASCLLAVLLIAGPQGIERSDLNALIWPGKTNASALNNTNTALRKAFGRVFHGDEQRVRIQTHGDRYALEWDDDALWWDWQALKDIATQPKIGIRLRREAERLYHADWMSHMEHWLPPHDVSVDAEEQWERVANSLCEMVRERRKIAAKWMRKIRERT